MNGRAHNIIISGTALLFAVLTFGLLARTPDNVAESAHVPPAESIVHAERAGERIGQLAHVEWAPERPREGTIFTVRVSETGPALDSIAGTIAGEPLHFVRDGEAHTALAAVPIDAAGVESLRIEVWAEDGRHEARTLDVSVASGEYEIEELSVAPEYSRRDAATNRRIRREVSRAKAVSRESHGTPRMWEAPFVRPRPGRLTSEFGHARIFNGEVQSRHMGTDFAGDVGAPVHATARGIVALVDTFYLGGNVVYIDHGAGLVTAYLHLSEAGVAEGDTVSAGQAIGRVGATGRVTGPHLHWIVRYGTTTVDGMSLPGIQGE